MTLNSIVLTADQLLLSTDPVPITDVIPWKDREGTLLGSSIEVAIPLRKFEKIVVRVKNCTLCSSYQPGKKVFAEFKGLTARAYAFNGKSGILSGWTANADSVELVEGGDFL